MRINILSIALLSRKSSGKKKIRAKHAKAVSGCNLFPSLHVSSQCCVYTWSSHLSECCGLCGGGWILCCQKSNTCHMADVHCGRSKHPSPVFVSVLCTCEAAAAGGICRVDVLTPLEAERLRKDQFGDFSSAFLHNPTEFTDITNTTQEKTGCFRA